MRKTILLVVAVLTLAMVFAAPATAAPKALTWDVSCDRDGNGSLESAYVVTAKGTPGWGFDTSPGLLLGGHFTFTPEVGAPETWEVPRPPGLEPRLTTCRIEGPHEAVGFDFLVDPAYILLTGAP